MKISEIDTLDIDFLKLDKHDKSIYRTASGETFHTLYYASAALNQFCLYSVTSAEFRYWEALGKIIIGGPYPPSNAIIYMHLQL